MLKEKLFWLQFKYIGQFGLPVSNLGRETLSEILFCQRDWIKVSSVSLQR